MPIEFNLLKTLAGHSRDVNAVAFSRDSKRIASGGGDKTVRLWDVATQQILHSLEHGEWVNDVVFAPSGQMVASAARNGSLKVWNVESGQLLGTILAHPKTANTVDFSPDGRRLASGGGEGSVRVVNLQEKQLERSIDAHEGWVWCVRFSPLGDRLVSSGADGAARIWQIGETLEPILLEGDEGDVLNACFSPDGLRIATACADGGMRVWDAESGDGIYAIAAHEGAANSVSYSPDGAHIVTGGADHIVRIWDAADGRTVRELTGHQDYVSAVAFAPDGQHMASCGGDGTVKIWEATDRAAYGVAGRDPDLELEMEGEAPRSHAYSTTYSVGKTIVECALKSGLKITLLQAGRDKHALGVGDPARPAVTIGGDALTIISGDGAQLFTFNLASQSVEYDRTDGAAAPWAEKHDPLLETDRLADLETSPSELAVAAGSGLEEFEFERPAAAPSKRYQSFEKHGQALARERTSTGKLFRLVRFDADTLYLLFADQDDPTLVLHGEALDVRDAEGTPLFRANLRTLEPVMTRRTPILIEGAEPVEEIEAEQDPLFVTGLEVTSAEAAPPRLHRILSRAVWAGASDVHVRSGAPIEIRLHGSLQPFEHLSFSPSETEAMLLEVLTAEQRQRFLETNDLDFSYDLPTIGRFRANICRQHRGIDGTFRAIANAVPSLEDLGLPPAVPLLTKHHQGLVLITGPAGQGKSTTIAALVDLINTEKAVHVITVEDPIEFVHPIKRSMVNQREVGRHTKSFANALRAALREDPDVIVVGEMRDLETISLAITAAETGHLVFGSLMTMSASQTIDRILDSFPAGQQAQIRTMLSESLKGIVSQQLVPTVGGDGRVLACEVLLGTPAVANLIRERKTFQLPSVMQTGRNLGMQRMDDALADLVQAGQITPEKAMQYAQDPKAFDVRVKARTTPEPVTAGPRK